MPLEYKKHQWIIYPIDKELLTVGYPLAIVEAQASGVGVIMYNARNDLIDFVSENGYLYTQIDEVIDIIKNDFDNTKRLNAINLCSRYNIDNTIPILETFWFD
jgi:glycosyltransferase involved in cell wall biosynthesis